MHSKWFTLAGFDTETGELFKVPKVANEASAMAAVFAALPTPRCGAMESGTNAVPMHRVLAPYFDNLIIVAPNKVWDRRRDDGPKTDHRDAIRLAEELSYGRLRPIYLPDDPVREQRTLGRGRIQTVQEQTRQVNGLYALLRSWGTPIEKKLLTQQGRTWLETVTFPEHAALVLEQQVARLDALRAQKAALDVRIATLVQDDPLCQLLSTIPCVGPLTALVVRAEIGAITRFATADQLVSYAGLAPRVIQSGERCRYGGLTKHGNAYLRRPCSLRRTRCAASQTRPSNGAFTGSAGPIIPMRLKLCWRGIS